jgi:hypothetical protein
VGARDVFPRISGQRSEATVLMDFSCRSLPTIIRNLAAGGRSAIETERLRLRRSGCARPRVTFGHPVTLFPFTIGRRVDKQTGFGSVARTEIGLIIEKSPPRAVRSLCEANSLKEPPKRMPYSIKGHHQRNRQSHRILHHLLYQGLRVLSWDTQTSKSTISGTDKLIVVVITLSMISRTSASLSTGASTHTES